MRNKVYFQKYYQKNKEKINKYQKEYRQNNREKIREYRQNNRKKLQNQSKEYYQRPDVQIRARIYEQRTEVQKRRRDATKRPNNRYTLYKKWARRRNYEFNLSFEEFMTFWQNPCYYCGKIIKIIGLDRIDNNKGYIIGNVVSCWTRCNQMKSTYNQQEFLNHCKQIVDTHFEI